MDDIWSTLFNGHPTHVKQLPVDACFERAVIIPAGYTSPIWSNNRALKLPPCPKLIDSFSDFVLARYGLETISRVPKRVVIIDRQPYTAHPRSKPHMPRKLGNLEVRKFDKFYWRYIKSETKYPCNHAFIHSLSINIFSPHARNILSGAGIEKHPY